MPRLPAWTHERRRSLRVDVPARVPLEVRRIDTDTPVSLRQIGTGGLVVTGHEALHPESPYDVQVSVEGHRTLHLEGRVVYSRATMAVDAARRAVYVSAVAFENVTEDDRRELARIVAAVGGTGTVGVVN